MEIWKPRKYFINKTFFYQIAVSSFTEQSPAMDEVFEDDIRISGSDLVSEDQDNSFDEAPVDTPSLDEEEAFEPSRDLQEPISLSNKNSVTNTVQQVSSTKTNGGVSNFASISTSTVTGGQKNDNTSKDYLPPKLNKRSSFRN